VGTRKGFKRPKLPFDSGHVKHFSDGTRLHYHPGDRSPHIDKVDPERNWLGHLLGDVISGCKGAPIKSYWTQRTRKIKGVEKIVLVRKRKSKVEIRIV